MRIIFMGTDIFAVPALKAIAGSSLELVAVITQPDRPKGRKLKLTPSPVKKSAQNLSLEVYQPEKVSDKTFINEVLKPIKPDIIVVAAYGQILSSEIIHMPPIGCINIHPSLLPKLRGAAPIQRAIINGDKETGVTIMFLDEGEDTGDIIIQDRTPINLSDTAEDLFIRLSELGSQMLMKVLDMAQKQILPRYPQDDTKATHAPRLTKEVGRIDWNKSSIDIHNLIRGTIPWPGAYTNFNEKLRVKIWESWPVSDLSSTSGSPGIIVDIVSDKGIIVSTGQDELLLKTIQPPNKAKMDFKDFVNGYRVKIGDMFI
ncbi:methionyl-tRNA formyltransferase [Candidatus Poribacteria bacterium]|nr:methionyl-tRNA formyltransferase [Candidatus Poribacteria bacterium]